MSRHILPLLVIILLTFLVYLPGLGGSFMFDDEPNILRNEVLHIDSLTLDNLRQAALSGQAGPLKRPLAMMSFAINYYLAGLQPWSYKLVNLCIHLLNGLMVYIAGLLLFRHTMPEMPTDLLRKLALILAGAWLLHPLNLTSVLYVVQRMTSLSASGVLAGVCLYLYLRTRCNYSGRWLAALYAGIGFCGLVAVASKESGALLPVFLLVIEACLLGFRTGSSAQAIQLKRFFALTVGVPAFATILFLIFGSGWLEEAFRMRPFSMDERLLTETRVVWFYLSLIVLPLPSRLSIFHDDLSFSTGLLQPVSTLASLVMLVVACIYAWRVRHENRWLSFAWFWFLTGHLMESTFLPLELVHEHRNYVALIGPLVCLCAYLGRLANDKGQPRVYLVSGMMIIFLGFSTAVRSSQWSDALTLNLAASRHHPGSARIQYELGRQYFILYQQRGEPGILDNARLAFNRSMELSAYRQKPVFGLMLIDAIGGQPVNPEHIQRLQQRLALQPFQAADALDLKVIVDCLQQSVCTMHGADVMRLFAAILNSPGLTNRVRALVLTQLGSYYSNKLGDIEAALNIFEEVVRIQPDVALYRLNLVQALRVSGQLQRARAELDRLGTDDQMGAFDARIGAERARLVE